jgi:hypothetical protein
VQNMKLVGDVTRSSKDGDSACPLDKKVVVSHLVCDDLMKRPNEFGNTITTVD